MNLNLVWKTVWNILVYPVTKYETDIQDGHVKVHIGYPPDLCPGTIHNEGYLSSTYRQ